MKKPISRWLGAVGTSAVVSSLLVFGTGCGALKAAANPKVAWALSDPAPMSVVVRRADVAEKTATNVDRLMTDTPANDDSAWLAKVAVDKEDAQAELVALRKNDLYTTNVKIVAAEVWAKSLGSLESKAPAPATTPASTPAAAAVAATAVAKDANAKDANAKDANAPSAPATDAIAQNDSAAPAAEAAPKPGKKKNGKGKTGKGKTGGKGNKVAKKTPPAEDKAAATPLADKSTDAVPTSTTTTTAANVADANANSANSANANAVNAVNANANANTNSANSANAKYASLLAAVDKDLADAWSKVMDKKKAMGDARGQIAVLEAANDEKGISDADKKANKAKIDDLDKQADALEKEADQLTKDFIPKAKEAAKKTPADVREKIGPVLVNLQKAVDDAGISNGAAAVRYPLAVTTLIDSAKTMVKVYAADVIEEKTGKRPNMSTLQPGVTLEDGKVAVTINGLSTSDMGKISMGELTSEVASRTTAWVKHATGLLGTIAATKEVLGFEDDVLSALIDGFKSGGWNPPAPVTIPEAPPAGAAGPPRS